MARKRAAACLLQQGRHNAVPSISCFRSYSLSLIFPQNFTSYKIRGKDVPAGNGLSMNGKNTQVHSALILNVHGGDTLPFVGVRMHQNYCDYIKFLLDETL